MRNDAEHRGFGTTGAARTELRDGHEKRKRHDNGTSSFTREGKSLGKRSESIDYDRRKCLRRRVVAALNRNGRFAGSEAFVRNRTLRPRVFDRDHVVNVESKS
jgi:hypothetical protein